MNFTPNINVGRVFSGFLTITVVGLIGWVSHVTIAPAPINGTQDTIVAQESFQTSGGPAAIVPAVELAAEPGVRSEYYQPVYHRHGHRSWARRNAPILGGAGAGALIGGLAGGGKGALIGGAIGGGGGYAYKRYRGHQRRERYYRNGYYRNGYRYR
jgi:hypothetical protein